MSEIKELHGLAGIIQSFRSDFDSGTADEMCTTTFEQLCEYVEIMHEAQNKVAVEALRKALNAVASCEVPHFVVREGHQDGHGFGILTATTIIHGLIKELEP